MALIIKLACEAANLRSRYAKTHHVVFGLSIQRQMLILRKKKSAVFAENIHELKLLVADISDLASKISALDKTELPLHAGPEVYSNLVQFVQSLLVTTQKLHAICDQLVSNEPEYRESVDHGRSQFLKDKLSYDQSIQELDHWGSQLNSLFAHF